MLVASSSLGIIIAAPCGGTRKLSADGGASNNNHLENGENVNDVR